MKKPPFGSTADSDSSLGKLLVQSFSKMLRAPVPAFNRDSAGIGNVVCGDGRSLKSCRRESVREVAGCLHVGTVPAPLRKVHGSVGGGTIPGWQNLF